MASRTDPIADPEEVRRLLKLLAEDVEEIPQAAEDWDLETATLEFEMTWWDRMVALLDLYLTHRAGLMTPEQDHQFRELVRRFHEYLPLVRRMGLSEPLFSLEEVLREAA